MVGEVIIVCPRSYNISKEETALKIVLDRKRGNRSLPFLVLISVALILLVSCNSEEEYFLPENPEDFARLVIKYKYTANEKGITSLLCKECLRNPYKGLSRVRRLEADRLSEYGVNFFDDESHDFTDVKCNNISEDSRFAIFLCEGNYLIMDTNQKPVSTILLREKIELKKNGKQWGFCPPVCRIKK